jgi:parallel beta-helix repeat protein
MKKIVVLFSLVMLLFGITLSVPTAPRTVLLWSFLQTNLDEWNDRKAEIEKKFNVNIQTELIAQNSFLQKLQAVIQEGKDGPDIAEWLVEDNKLAADPKDCYAAPLDDYVKNSAVMKTIPSGILARVKVGGHIYGLPHAAHPVVLVYNDTLWKEACVDIAAVKTWDEFFAGAKKLIAKQEGGKPLHYALPAQDTGLNDTMFMIWQQTGAQIFDASGKPAFTGDKVKGFMEQWIRWKDTGAFAAWDWGNFAALLEAGKLASYTAPDWWVAQVDNAAKAGNYQFRVRDLPEYAGGNGSHTASWGGSFLFIPKNSKDKSFLWNMIEYMQYGGDCAKIRYEKTGMLAPLPQAWNDPVFKQPDDRFGGQKLGELQVRLAKELPSVNGSDVFWDALAAFGRQYPEMINKKESVAQGLQNTQDAVLARLNSGSSTGSVTAGWNEPEIITDTFVKEHFYDRPPEIVIDTKKYGLDGKSFYVSALKGSDNNPGTIAEPFLTIQHAVGLCNAGDTVYVMEGVYRNKGVESVAGFWYQHGTPDHWIVLRNYPGHNPFLIFNGWNGISVAGSSFIIVSGFIIKGNSDGITYDYAYQNRKNTSNPVTMGNGVQVFFASNDYSKRSHHVIVMNNIMYNSPGCGISTLLVDYVSLMNNIVCYNTKWSPFSTSGIATYQNQAIDASKEIKMIVSGNVIYGNENKIPFISTKSICDGNGIIIDDSKHTQNMPYSTPDRYMGKTLVENNICFDNGGQGISVFQSEFATIRNNTCYNNARSKDFNGGRGEIYAAYSDSVIIQGNIAVSTNRNGSRALHSTGCSNIEISYNLFKGIVDNPGPGKNSIIEKDPQFINAMIDPVKADFHLNKQSPALDICPSGPTVDFDGKSRPQGSGFDIGAYEYLY